MRPSAKSWRVHLMSGAAAGTIMLGAGPSLAQPIEPLDIAPQSLASALYEFGSKTDRQMMFSPEVTASKTTRGVSAAVDEKAALAQLLDGTGLTFRRQDDVYMIVQQGGSGDPQGGSVAGGGAEVEALIVTAQKREEDIQDVPIAISAFSQQDLEAQKLEGGFDLLKAVPNVTFSKNNFTGYNFSIRGIGTKAISATTDPGVAVSFNNTTFLRNRLFEQEYFDVERVEVLRGPQGTLYGRNATGGVVNMITAKPTDHFEGSIKVEVGNYNARRSSGFINVPLLDDKLAVRIAGAYTQRDGYGFNLTTGNKVDSRDLWSGRITVAFTPTERLRANLVWEHFDEDDSRARTSKQLCKHDPGPSELNGVSIPTEYILARGILSQGCQAGSLYDASAYGTPNGFANPLVFTAWSEIAYGYTLPINTYPQETQIVQILPNMDPFGNRTQVGDLRAFESNFDPIYRAEADIFQLNIDLDLGDSLTLSSQTAYNRDQVYSRQDFFRYSTQVEFNDSSRPLFNNGQGVTGGAPECINAPCPADFNITPGGVFNDPQLGKSSKPIGVDISRGHSHQFAQEFRLQSNFTGPLNFSSGASYTEFTDVDDYYVFLNLITILAEIKINQYNRGLGPDPMNTCLPNGPTCTYIDPNPIDSINDRGHNYFLSRNPYKLRSRAAFGEAYWQATDALKFTVGLRYTDDRKTFTPIPSQVLLSAPTGPFGSFCATADLTTPISLVCALFGTTYEGYTRLPDIDQRWRKFTGRVGVDWKPTLSFTDQTMVYAFLSRGYKGGGANPPGVAGIAGSVIEIASNAAAPATFDPEYVNAFEVGAKNVLFGGGLILNASAFFYDYKGYQISKIVDRRAINENFDSRVWGAELETVWSPNPNLRFNATFGYLDTELGEGSRSIDLMDRTQGNSDWVTVKPFVTLTSNCIAPKAAVAAILAADIDRVESNPYALPTSLPASIGTSLPQLCMGLFKPGGFHEWDYPGVYFDILADPAINGGAGFYADLSGNELPNSPHWTQSIGVQYTWDFSEGWQATLRGDFYHQSQSFARVYNTEYDKLHGWKNGNVSLLVEQPDSGLAIEAYVKNVFDDEPITDSFMNSDDTYLSTNVFTLDPRLIGLSIRKRF